MAMQHLLAAASVIGQAHTGSAPHNQDAYIVREYAFGLVMAVADGLGSKPLSHTGSRAACRAVCEAARIWSRQAQAPVAMLVRLVHTLWELHIAPHAKPACGTTCLFAIMFNSGRLICCQLGDGLIGYATHGDLHIVRAKSEEFLNLTQSLHTVSGAEDWTWVDVQTGTQPVGILMATDGVSEDLIPEKQNAFLQYLQEQMAREPLVRQRHAAIRKLLLNWPTKHNYDDKTLVVFQRGVSAQ